MPTGPGFWLNPNDGALHQVVTHIDWLLDSQNQQKVGLHPEQIEVLRSLDPVREIDEIRLVGVLAGLVRIRDYSNRVSIQFYVSHEQLGHALRSVLTAMPHITADRFAFLTIQNLSDDASASIDLPDLEAKLQNSEPVLGGLGRIPYNEELRQKVSGLLERARVGMGAAGGSG